MTSPSDRDQPPEPNVRPSARPGGAAPPTTAEPGGGGRSLLFAALVVVLHTFLVGGFLVGTMVFGVRCEKTFRNFNLKLDESTLLVLAVARWLNNYWYVLVPVFLLCCLMDGAILFLLHRSPRTRRWSNVWTLAVGLLILLFSGCMGGPLYLSYNRMLDGLSR